MVSSRDNPDPSIDASANYSLLLMNKISLDYVNVRSDNKRWSTERVRERAEMSDLMHEPMA